MYVTQGRNEVPGKKQVWRPPMFEPEVFGSKCTVLKKLLVTMLGNFGALIVICHPEDCPPCPLVTPLTLHTVYPVVIPKCKDFSGKSLFFLDWKKLKWVSQQLKRLPMDKGSLFVKGKAGRGRCSKEQERDTDLNCKMQKQTIENKVNKVFPEKEVNMSSD